MYARFDWHFLKAELNARKHGISFRKAVTAFQDPLGLILEDPDRSQSEERFLLLAHSVAGNLLVVAHTQRGETVWIVSARRASLRERRSYEQEAKGDRR